MRFYSVFGAAAAATLAVANPSAAQAATAIDYNLFVLNNMTVTSGDTEGSVAVGGNANVSSYSVGNQASAGATNFVVRGNLTAGSGSAKGSTIVGGTASASVGQNKPFTTTLLPSGTPLPVDFTAEAQRLTLLAAGLSGYASNGTVGTVPWGGQFTLNATLTGLNVFDISAAALATSNTFTINLAAGQTALINVKGGAASFTGGLVINGGGSASDVLWNFYDATSLNIQYTNMLGTVLAPKATFTSGGGQMHGTLIVNNFTGGQYGGSMEMHADKPYTGGLLTPPIPEPGTWAMMIAGFGLLGGVLRRRKAAILA